MHFAEGNTKPKIMCYDNATFRSHNIPLLVRRVRVLYIAYHYHKLLVKEFNPVWDTVDSCA